MIRGANNENTIKNRRQKCIIGKSIKLNTHKNILASNTLKFWGQNVKKEEI